VLLQQQTKGIVELIQEAVVAGVQTLYDQSITPESITWNVTRKEVEGDYTLVVFP